VPVDNYGCSSVTDSDGDGVPDGLDACPDTPARVAVSAQGCPETELFRPLLPRVLEGVRFEAGTAQLAPESRDFLDSLAVILKRFPEDVFEIGAHTDSTGDAVENRAVSQRRAEAVRAFLIGRGLRPEQILARGYGEEVPVADNTTAEGRERNRRIELRRLEPGLD
jgi:OOP family OmpA-OmpF porin